MQDFIFVRTLKGHSDQVTSVAFSADGQILASGDFLKSDKKRAIAKQKVQYPSKIDTFYSHRLLSNTEINVSLWLFSSLMETKKCRIL